jgi:hypothetical protein
LPNIFHGLAFSPEVFIYAWSQAPSVIQTQLLNSGILVRDPLIDEAASVKGGITFSLPFYKELTGTPDVWNETNDVSLLFSQSGYQNAVAINRHKGFAALDIDRWMTGDDPIMNVVRQVAHWWDVYDQSTILGLLNTVLSVTPTTTAFVAPWQNHTLDISATGTNAATDDNRIAPGTLSSLAVRANGDLGGGYRMAIMHSAVADRLSQLQLLNYWMYTDAQGMQQRSALASINGYTVWITDQVPVDTSGTNPKYTTYLIGEGALRSATRNLLPANEAAEPYRDAIKQGGVSGLITRKRGVLHPNGLSFALPNGSQHVTDTILLAAANWDVAFDPKTIRMARLISNG